MYMVNKKRTKSANRRDIMKIMDNRGVSVVAALMILVTSIVAFAFLFFCLGNVINAFTMEFQNIDMVLDPDFAEMMQYPTQYFQIFFALPALFLLLITIWAFKTIIYRKQYSREDEDW